jgi:hypothetical protein
MLFIEGGLGLRGPDTGGENIRLKIYKKDLTFVH